MTEPKVYFGYAMGWQKLIGSPNYQLSFGKEPYFCRALLQKKFGKEPYFCRALLQKRPENLWNLQIVATSYLLMYHGGST